MFNSKTKKIFKLILLSFFLIGFLLPLNTQAEEKNWYYLIFLKDMGNGQKVSFVDEAECNTKRTEFVNSTTYKEHREIYLDVGPCTKEAPPKPLPAQETITSINTDTTYT